MCSTQESILMSRIHLLYTRATMYVPKNFFPKEEHEERKNGTKIYEYVQKLITQHLKKENKISPALSLFFLMPFVIFYDFQKTPEF